MTPEEKAKELFKKFSRRTKFLDEFKGWIEIVDSSRAKQFALVAVDEIINNNNKIPGNVDGLHTSENSNYWLDVKHEIENL
jgi:hypothetical protein